MGQQIHHFYTVNGHPTFAPKLASNLEAWILLPGVDHIFLLCVLSSTAKKLGTHMNDERSLFGISALNPWYFCC